MSSIKIGAGILSLKLFNGYVDPVEKIPQDIHFRCGLLHIKDSLKNIGNGYKLEKSLLKQELEHVEIYEDNWEQKGNEWLLYLKNDALSTAFSYARYSKGMEAVTGFGMKNSLTLSSLANKSFSSLRDETNEPIYTYNDELIRHFVRQSIKGGRWSSLNQCHTSTIPDQVSNIMSEELGVDGNICEISDKNFEYKNQHRKMLEDEYDSQNKGYRDMNHEERTKYISNKLIQLPIHEHLQKLNLNDVMMDFDSSSLYPSAMSDKSSVYPKKETGLAFKPHMNVDYVKAFNIQIFNQYGDESALLRKKYYSPPNNIFQHLPVKGKVKNKRS